MYIYLIEAEDTGYFKVGVTKNLKQRLKNLQTGNGGLLKIVEQYKTKYAYKIESAYKRRYRTCKLQGEWFEFNNNEDSNFIEDIKLMDKNFHIINRDKSDYEELRRMAFRK